MINERFLNETDIASSGHQITYHNFTANNFTFCFMYVYNY